MNYIRKVPKSVNGYVRRAFDFYEHKEDLHGQQDLSLRQSFQQGAEP